MKRTRWVGLILLMGCAAESPPSLVAQGTLVGGPCEGCEAVFEYGDRELTPTDTLPGFETAERPLLIARGTIYQADGTTPAEGVILYIYHTNEDGIYETRGDETGWATRHGFIRGWIRTGADGKYSFYTRLPGSYGNAPAHIHPTILEPDGRYYYIDEFVFEGDPNLDETQHESGRGGSSVISLTREGEFLVAERDIILGREVPGYDS